MTVLVNGVERAHASSSRRAASTAQPYGLNMGLVGVGSNNSRGIFDNFVVQVLPPQSTFDEHRGLRRRRRRPLHRRRRPAPGRSRPAATRARRRRPRRRRALMTLPARAAGDTEVDARGDGQGSSGGVGGLVFDYYSTDGLQVRRRSTSRPARSSSATGSGTSGSSTRAFTATLAAGVDYKLSLALSGTTVTVSLNGVAARLVLVQRRRRRRRPRRAQPDAARPRSTTSHVTIGTHVVNSPDSDAADADGAGERHALDRRRARRRRSSATRRSARRPRPTTSPSRRSSRSGVPAGNLFPIGVTTITWTATDVFGNQTVKTQTVTVVDTEKPVLDRAAERHACTIAGDAVVGRRSPTRSSARATATDNSGSVTIVRTRRPGRQRLPGRHDDDHLHGDRPVGQRDDRHADRHGQPAAASRSPSGRARARPRARRRRSTSARSRAARARTR